MQPKTILITGATDGIGKQTALELARQGHHLLIHGRSPARGEETVQEILRTTKNPNIEFLRADFASLSDVRQLAALVTEQYPRLDVLLNNAGVFMKQRTLTVDGFETTFQVNYLLHFLLTNLLLDLLRTSAPSRIVHVSSGTHRSGSIEWDNLQGERQYSGYDAYSRSKLANILFAYALADRLQGTNVTSNALHPGVISTKLLHAGWGGVGRTDASRGAETTVYAAVAPELDGVTGRFLDNRRISQSSNTTHDQKLQNKLWDVSAQMVGLPS